MADAPILVISGTNRPGSNTLVIARTILDHYRRSGARADLYDLQEMPAEIFHPSTYATKPAAWLVVQQRILDAPGLHLVLPEYNGSFPGILKYFVDMLKFPESFDHKPVAFTGLAAGMFGALRAVEQMQAIFSYRNAYVYRERVFVLDVRKKVEGGRLVDAEIDKRLAAQTAGFSEFVGRLTIAK